MGIAELVTVIVDGCTIEFTDATAHSDANGRVQVPVRFVGEALGACVEWDESRNQATFQNAGFAVILQSQAKQIEEGIKNQPEGKEPV